MDSSAARSTFFLSSVEKIILTLILLRASCTRGDLDRAGRNASGSQPMTAIQTWSCQIEICEDKAAAG
jgi:hypothetical protein